jgi:hypothetical protein
MILTINSLRIWKVTANILATRQRAVPQLPQYQINMLRNTRKDTAFEGLFGPTRAAES